MRLLVCGSRDWADEGLIERVLSGYARETVVIHGGAPGADKLAGAAAKKLGMSVDVFPADWAHYGKAAGPKRNQKMLDKGQPDAVIAFHPDLSQSKGTKDMIERSEKAGLSVTLITGRPTMTCDDAFEGLATAYWRLLSAIDAKVKDETDGMPDWLAADAAKEVRVSCFPDEKDLWLAAYARVMGAMARADIAAGYEPFTPWIERTEVVQRSLF